MNPPLPHTFRALALGGFLLLCSALTSVEQDRSLARPCAPTLAQTSGVPSLPASAQVAYVDPSTGRVLSPPPRPSPTRHSVGQPPQGPPLEWFAEIPGNTAGGGIKLNLQGRWRHLLLADTQTGDLPRLVCGHQFSTEQAVEQPRSSQEPFTLPRSPASPPPANP